MRVDLLLGVAIVDSMSAEQDPCYGDHALSVCVQDLWSPPIDSRGQIASPNNSASAVADLSLNHVDIRLDSSDICLIILKQVIEYDTYIFCMQKYL